MIKAINVLLAYIKITTNQAILIALKAMERGSTMLTQNAYSADPCHGIIGAITKVLMSAFGSYLVIIEVVKYSAIAVQVTA